ncbi:MAG: tail fiber domain-containing protein, partial [Pseudorhodoplanes sp.]
RACGFRGGYRGGGMPAFRGGGGFRGGGAAFAGGGFRGGGGAAFRGGGGGFRGGGGGGGFRGGGGGGRRSDIRLKTDIALVGRLDSGLGLYSFRYRGDPQTYVGVMAQDAQMVQPDAVTRGRDGYFRVRYDKIGFEMQTYESWAAHGRKQEGR